MKHSFRQLRALCLILALLLCVGCGGETGTELTQAAASLPAASSSGGIVLETTVANELFTLPWDAELTINPYNCVSRANSTFLPLIYEGLFCVSGEFEAEPVLCSEWNASDDLTVYSFTLKEDVCFHSGEVLTVEDVIYSLEYAMTSPLYEDRLSCITSLDAYENTVFIGLDSPRDSFLLLLDVPIVRRGTAELEIPDGTGPYVPVLNREGESYLDRYAGGRLYDELGISRIYLNAVSGAGNIRDEFETGRISLVCTDPNSGVSAIYHGDYEKWSAPTTILEYVGFNFLSGPFAQKVLRQAVIYCIDRDAAVTGAFGGCADASVLPVSPYSRAWSSELSALYRGNGTKAASLLRDAGIRDTDGDGVLEYTYANGIYTDDVSGTLIVCSDSDSETAAAELLAADLCALGMDIRVEALDADTYAARRNAGNYDLFLESIRLTADFDLTPLLSAAGSLDGEALRLCADALENVGNYYDLCDRILEQGLLCPVAFRQLSVMAVRGTISGLSPGSSDIFRNPQDLCLTTGAS